MLVREGLVQTLRQLDTGVSVFEAVDYAAASTLLAQDEAFDLVLLDLGLPGLDGMSCLRSFRQGYPELPVVILSAYDDAHTVSKAMSCGAAAFIPKSSSSDYLLMALREVLAGRTPPEMLSPPVSVAISTHFPKGGRGVDPSVFGLTERQTDVLGLMVRGKSNRDIAAALGLSEGTVKIHLRGVFKAFRVKSRTQAMLVVSRYAIRL